LGTIECVVTNKGPDTLLLLSKPFLLDGQVRKVPAKVRPWPGSSYAANVLIYEEKGVHYSYVGDADIKPHFKVFPDLLVLVPGGRLRLTLHFTVEQEKKFQNGTYTFWTTISYAQKAEFGKIVANTGALLEMYRKSLKTVSRFTVQLDDSLAATSEKNGKLSQVFWDGMKLKAISEKVQITR
jgi:hypothetical protein